MMKDAEDEKNAAIGRATEQWTKANPGKKPDYFNDIVPLINQGTDNG